MPTTHHLSRTAVYTATLLVAMQLGNANAQERRPDPGDARKPNPPAEETRDLTNSTAIQKQLVKVVLATSRPEVTRNHGWGLTADVTNVSSHPVTMFNNEVQLVLHPEATQNTKCDAAFASFLPNTANTSKSPAIANDGSDGQITVQPGEHYMFFWSGVDTGAQKGGCALSWWGSTAEELNFIPGAYTFNVEGKLHTADSSEPYHTFVESVTVKLGIEQLSVLLFAGIGATLAYFVVALGDTGDVDKLRKATSRKEALAAVGVIVRNIVSAFLLGAILSVVANRLSETQFPVKVSVSDVWGALTVGFVFFFIGDKMIKKLRDLAT